MIVLASASPRRKELLSQLVTQYTIVPADINEAVKQDELAADYVVRMATEKARASLALVCDRQDLTDTAVIVIGADTSVVLGDNILGKPADEAAAVAMLMELSGQTHQVITAVALVDELNSQLVYSSTEVRFRSIVESEARAYWNTGEPADKAGGYGIQGFGAVFVESLQGSYSGVVGLPLYETANLLKHARVRLWQMPETDS